MTIFKLGFITLTLIDIIDILLVTWVFVKVYQYFRENFARFKQMLLENFVLKPIKPKISLKNQHLNP